MAVAGRQWTDTQIGGAIRELRREYDQHMTRLRVRRLLIEMTQDAFRDNATGTNVPEPFNKSRLILRTMIGDPIKEVQRYASRISANAPTISVPALTRDERPATDRAKKVASELERLLQGMWSAAGGRTAQRRMAFSQVWARRGYLFSLPSDAAWGMPARKYHSDLTDDEVATLKREGKLSATELEDDEGGMRWAESGKNWMERRREYAKDKHVNGESLNTLEALPPDMVYVKRDDVPNPGQGRDIKYAAIVGDIPMSDYKPGEEESLKAAKYLGVPEADIGAWGIYLDSNGKIQGGITQAREHNEGQTAVDWLTMTRFVTRDEVYWYLSGPDVEGGKTIWHERHGDGRTPLFEAPFYETDSRTPGHEASSPLEAIWALTPIINQIETLLSSVAIYNSTPRWVVENANGELQTNEETGEPQIVGNEPTIGLDPQQAQPVSGRVRQLVIDADLLYKLLEFYSRQLENVKIPAAAIGAAGASGPAWNIRQQIQQTQQDLEPAVDNSAAVVRDVLRVWMDRARRLDMPMFLTSLPGARANDQSARGLIEIDPKDLIDNIVVVQDSHTASDRTVAIQVGEERLKSGTITKLQFYEEYAMAQDARAAEVDSYVELVVQFVMLGDTTKLQPGSVMYNVASGIQGRMYFETMARSSNAAVAEAERMAAQVAQQQAAAAEQAALEAGQGGIGDAGGGRPAEAAGLRQAGVGMGEDLGGSAAGGIASSIPR